MSGQEPLGDAHDLALLRGRDGLERATLPARASRAHLAEDERVVVERDEVDLAGRGAHVAGEDREAARREVCRGTLFAVPSAALAITCHAIARTRIFRA